MRKTKAPYWLTIAVILVFLTACSTMPTRVTSIPLETIGQVQRPWYGDKARVAVMEFDNKTGVDFQVSHSLKGTTVGNPIGSGMKEQIVTALMQTGAFIVLERQALKDVMGEQDLGASGRMKRETAAAIGELEGAEFLIYGAVTEYLPSQASAAAGVGVDPIFGYLGSGLGGPLFGVLVQRAAAAVMANQDHVAIDIRLVDAKTGRVVSATSVQGNPQDFGGSLGGIFGSVLLGVSAQYQTPMQKAVRACIIKAVNWVADNCLDTREKGGQMVNAPVPSSTGEIPSDPKIKKIQKGLNGLGYHCGKADGRRGEKTEACIAQFLQDNKIVEAALEEELEKKLSQKPAKERKEGPMKLPVTPVGTSNSIPPSTPPDLPDWSK
jgi:curli biogenesis system outer membrane secretion channel CsgG